MFFHVPVSAVGGNKGSECSVLICVSKHVNELCVFVHTCIFGSTDCWYDLQKAREGNRLGKKNPGFPKSLSLFWTLVTAMHTDHNCFSVKNLCFRQPQNFFLFSIFFLTTQL